MNHVLNQPEKKKPGSNLKWWLIPCAIVWLAGGYFLLYLVVSGAFRSVAQESQSAAIECNFRILVSAADQYFLENGVTEVRATELVGEDKYIRTLEPVGAASPPCIIRN